MSDLLDRMREAVTAPLRIPGLTGEKEVQLVNDACLKSLEEIVRADELERCIQMAKECKSLNDDDVSIVFNDAISCVIEAIRKAEGPEK